MNEDLRHFSNIIDSGSRSEKKYLVESVLNDQWNELNEDTRKIFVEFDNLIPLLSEYSALAYTSNILLEADGSTKLNDKQVKQLFMVTAQAISYKKEQGSLKGYAPSMKTDDINVKKEGIIKKVRSTLSTQAKKLQDTAPVKGFDNIIDGLIDKVHTKLGDDSKVVKYTKEIGEYSKKHPKISNFAIGVLTAAATFAGTPMAGMAVGMLLRTSVGLMKDEKFSTALGKAAMVAGIGIITGAVLKEIIDVVSQAADAAIPIELTVEPPKPVGTILQGGSFKIQGTNIGFHDLSYLSTKEQGEIIRQLASDKSFEGSDKLLNYLYKEIMPQQEQLADVLAKEGLEKSEWYKAVVDIGTENKAVMDAADAAKDVIAAQAGEATDIAQTAAMGGTQAAADKITGEET